MVPIEFIIIAGLGTNLAISVTRYAQAMTARTRPGVIVITREEIRQSICSVYVGKVKFHVMQ